LLANPADFAHRIRLLHAVLRIEILEAAAIASSSPQAQELHRLASEERI
jgi:hypothetical protein